MKLTSPSFITKLLVGLVLFVILKIALDVSTVPNYRGANAYISLSPDGRYKALRLYVENERKGEWSEFALGMGGYATNPLFAIADASSGEILAFYHPPSNWRSNGFGGIWSCGESRKEDCTGYSFPYSDEISLPPSWWKRTHAKLAVKLKGLENPQFKKVTVYE